MQKNRIIERSIAILFLMLSVSGNATNVAIVQDSKSVNSSERIDLLKQEFKSPSQNYRPRVWWHWMDGNVSESGIKKDIEWMVNSGIGGLQNFDAALASPQIVDERVSYFSEKWKKAFKSTAQLAKDNNLELAIASSPGWSSTGGPWVAPKDGMKKLVWSNTFVSGGAKKPIKLKALPHVSGPFQDVVVHGEVISPGGANFKRPNYVQDIAVFAYPSAEADLQDISIVGTYTDQDGGVLPADILSDGLFNDVVEIKKPTNLIPTYVQVSFPTDKTIRSLQVFIPGAVSATTGVSLVASLEVMDSKSNTWKTVTNIRLALVPVTKSFAATTGRDFRLKITPNNDLGVMAMMPAAPGVDMLGLLRSFGADGVKGFMGDGGRYTNLAEFNLRSSPRINDVERKAGFAIVDNYYKLEVGPNDNSSIASKDLLNITDRLQADGSLVWQPPPGEWKILRIGYSLTGKANHPATAEGTGLEVDKLDAGAVERYLRHYLGMYKDFLGDSLMGQYGLQAMLTDSIEVGMANWTPTMVKKFEQLRGYNPLPWLPALTGLIVESREKSDAFLYDYRRTLAELLSSEYYATIAKVTNEFGLISYGEAQESGRYLLGDDMTMRSFVDIPMAMTGSYSDMRGAASIAHITGRPRVAAESLTSAFQPWSSAPADLKPAIDFAFANGVNLPVIHTSVHQPTDDHQPGLALLVFGQYFNRHESWASMARPWMDYMARSSVLLQYGSHVADVAYFYGEDAPLAGMYKTAPPADLPEHYDYDFVDADSLLNRFSFSGNTLRSSGGASYRVLYLGGSSQYMSLPVLKKLHALVREGAIIVGSEPQPIPSLAEGSEEFRRLVNQLWGGSRPNLKGKVISGQSIEAALESLDIVPDFDFSVSSTEQIEILFHHRRSQDAEIYYLNNRSSDPITMEAKFRVAGRKPYLWRADTGTREPLAFIVDSDITTIPLSLNGNDAVFVVFLEATDQKVSETKPTRWTVFKTIDSQWDVAFQIGRGAPEKITLDNLQPLNKSEHIGVKYFSGISSYTTEFDLGRQRQAKQPVMIDLGRVADIAQVYVNDIHAGTVWKAPYRIDIGHLLRVGANKLEIRVANLWVNRLIGDMQDGAEKITWTSTPVYLKSAPLRDSGLIGPVTLMGAN